MKTLGSLLLLGVMSILVAGCETTGDPTQGGIFWSERKAQGRLDRREDTLHRVDGQTRRVERRNDNLENAAARRRRLLGE